MTDRAQIDANTTLMRHTRIPGLFQANRFVAMPLAANVNGPHSKRVHAVPFVGQIPTQTQIPAQTQLPHEWYRTVGKRGLDIAFVLAAMPVALLFILISAVVLWAEGGNPFYRQDRLGKNGKVFSILKLRTMVKNADERLAHYLENDPALKEEWEQTQKLKKDPRITRIGAALRATSLDELPQLWNVLKGDMSLVGPRPMMPEQLSLYGDKRAYFALQPGITGLWQVSVRNESEFSQRTKADAEYYRDVSLRQDLGLLLRTVGVVIRGTGY